VLNGGKPATYRVVFPLRVPGRHLGVIRLATIRPGGFRPANLARAHEATDRAAMLLEAIEAAQDQTDRTPEPRGRGRQRRGQRASLRVCQPWPTDWSFPPDAC
jgi:hypothetical protein